MVAYWVQGHRHAGIINEISVCVQSISLIWYATLRLSLTLSMLAMLEFPVCRESWGHLFFDYSPCIVICVLAAGDFVVSVNHPPWHVVYINVMWTLFKNTAVWVSVLSLALALCSLGECWCRGVAREVFNSTILPKLPAHKADTFCCGFMLAGYRYVVSIPRLWRKTLLGVCWNQDMQIMIDPFLSCCILCEPENCCLCVLRERLHKLSVDTGTCWKTSNKCRLNTLFCSLSYCLFRTVDTQSYTCTAWFREGKNWTDQACKRLGDKWAVILCFFSGLRFW